MLLITALAGKESTISTAIRTDNRPENPARSYAAENMEKIRHLQGTSEWLHRVRRNAAGNWQAPIAKNGKRHCLGSFPTPEQAAAAYAAAKRELQHIVPTDTGDGMSELVTTGRGTTARNIVERQSVTWNPFWRTHGACFRWRGRLLWTFGTRLTIPAFSHRELRRLRWRKTKHFEALRLYCN